MVNILLVYSNFTNDMAGFSYKLQNKRSSCFIDSFNHSEKCKKSVLGNYQHNTTYTYLPQWFRYVQRRGVVVILQLECQNNESVTVSSRLPNANVLKIVSILRFGSSFACHKSLGFISIVTFYCFSISRNLIKFIKMIRLERCCCGCELRTGTIVFLVLKAVSFFTSICDQSYENE